MGQTVSNYRPLQDSLKPLEWILGKWRIINPGDGSYPTIESFKYSEEMEFYYTGKHFIQFSLNAIASGTGDVHRDVGFICMKPGTNKVAFICAQSTGLAEIEEGEVNGTELNLETTTIGQISFGRPSVAKKVKRSFMLKDNKLEKTVTVQTNSTELTQHIWGLFQKV